MSPARRRPSVAPLLVALALVAGSLGLAGTSGRVAAAGTETLIAVVGDFGFNNAAEASVATQVAGWSPAAVLSTGDNYYTTAAGGTGTDRFDITIGKYYCAFLKGAAAGPNCPTGGTADTNRFWATLGNHDYSDAGIANYLAYFPYPSNERYFVQRVGPVDVFVIDSDEALRTAADMAAQKTWLEAAAKASTAPWQVALFHHPPYSSSSSHGNSVGMRWPYADWGIDLVLNGHDHTYERSVANGITYVVNGLGGASRYSFGTLNAESVARYNGNHGAMRLVASDTSLTGSFVSVDGVTRDTFSVAPAVPALVLRDGSAPTAGYAGTADATLSQSAPTTARGAETGLLLDGDDAPGTGQDHAALVRWDVSAIPDGATITSATLSFTVTNVSTGTYEAYEVLRPWTEGEATWERASAAQAWTSPGATGADDRGTTVLGTLRASALGTAEVPLSAAGVALVQAWADGTKPAHGFVLANTATADGADLHSSESATVSARPALSVRYTLPTATPTPTPPPTPSPTPTPAPTPSPTPAPTSVAWSGATWAIKSSAGAVGPGPNRFALDNAWVDASGYLHLRIDQDGTGTWTSGEIVGPQTLGYGTYTFTLGSRVDALDPNAVLGLFTWSDAADYAHRELDIEFARWGNAADPTNAQYVVQPWDTANHLSRFTQPADAVTVHSFTWLPGSVTWESRTEAGTLIASKSYTGADVPVTGDERVRLNLWLYGGAAPVGGQPVEVIVRSFAFTAAPTATPTPVPTPTPAPTAGAFAKSSPKNGAKVPAGTITLSWAASANAESYEYCLSTTSTCSTWTSTGTARTATVTVATKGVTRWWQVRAVRGGTYTYANASTAWRFITR